MDEIRKQIERRKKVIAIFIGIDGNDDWNALPTYRRAQLSALAGNALVLTGQGQDAVLNVVVEGLGKKIDLLSSASLAYYQGMAQDIISIAAE